ncbi:MAG: YfhO family protein [Pseudomonadota bacterium]
MNAPSVTETSPVSSTPPASIRSTTGLALAVLLAVTLAFYHGLWLPGLVLIKRDAFRFYLPLKQYLIERLSAGELPQWFPYEALGRSFIGVAHTGVFHPFTALSFFFSVPDAYRASTLISCLLAALGAYALGRALNFSPMGACLAGLSFVLSGYVVSLTDSLLYLYSICLLPFFCLALDNALTKNRAWVLAPATLWATVFLLGDIQTGYYYGFIGLLWTLMRTPSSRYGAILRLALAAVLAALLAGIQLGPSWDVFVGSDRVQPVLFEKQTQGWSTHPLRLLSVLARPIREDVPASSTAGTPDALIPELSISYFWAESLYLGIPVTGLALLGAWHRPELRVLAWLGGAALLLALGPWGGLYAFFYHVAPLWSVFRYPEKFMGIVAFAAAMLAGAGLDTLRTGHRRSWPWLAAAALSLGAGLALPTEAGRHLASSLGASPALAQAITDAAAPACLLSAAAALGVAVIVATLTRTTLRGAWLLAGLVVIVALDLSRANLDAYHTAPAAVAEFNPPLVEALKAHTGSLEPGRFRVITLVDTLVAFPEQLERTLGHDAAVIVAQRQALAPLHNAEFHIETAKPYLPGYKAELIAMLRQSIGLQAAARYHVGYYIGLRSRLSDIRLTREIVAELPDYDLVLFRNPFPVKPRAYLSPQPKPVPSRADPAMLLKQPDFLSGEVDVIETARTTLPGPSPNGTAAIERYHPEGVRVQVETPQPAVLILLDAFEKGWTATLESGVEIPILRANALVRAVVVPAGHHVVTFSYQTPLLKAGAWTSLAGALLCMGLLVPAHWKKRHGNTSA